MSDFPTASYCTRTWKRCLNPYGFISGGLYTDSNTELNNGNERGVATPPTGESQIRFANVDFGEYGSDVVTLPLFSLTKDPFPVEIWEGVPGEKVRNIFVQ